MPPVKRRYVLFRLHGSPFDAIQEGHIVAAVREHVQRIHGDHGIGTVLLNLHLKHFEPRTGLGVLAVGRNGHRLLISSLPLMTGVRGQPITVTVVKLSGTLRGSLRSLQGLHGKLINQISNGRKQCI